MKNEDELAAVLAHECAHVVARHGAERLSQAQFLQVCIPGAAGEGGAL